jgi:2-C-methyl-D-erythritol 4-phosphate cytidylyltransferase
VSAAAVLVAAGSGTRLGHDKPKALVLLRGEPLFAHAARALVAGLAPSPGAPPGPPAPPAGAAPVPWLVVAAPADHLDAVATALAGLRLAATIRVVAGGATRQASVAAALAVLPADVDVVLVHDAARPTVPADVVARVLAAVRSGHGAVVPGIAVVDTVKRVGPGEHVLPVTQTVPRAELRAVQTPQGFARELLDRAHRAAAASADDESVAASDDAGLVERLGERVWVVPGDERAAKITTARDLAVAELLLSREDG